jgi:hypothetical protein
MSPLRQRYIAAGFITPCPYRNRPKLTIQDMLDQGYWSAAKAKMKAAEEGVRE